jgi:hypothetical protein
MAPRYPTYQRSARLSASITTPPNVDFAGLREAAKGGQQISQAADRVVSFAAKEIETQSEFRGAQDAAANPTGTLEQFQDSGPSNAYERAAYDAAVKISSADIEVKARRDIANSLMEWEQNKGDPTQLQARLASISAGYSDAIAQLDPVSGARLNGILSSAGSSAFLSYSETHLKEEQTRLAAGWNSASSSYQQEIEIAARNGMDIGPILAAAQATASNLGVAPATVTSSVEKLRLAGERARVRGEFDRAADKQQYINDFMADVGERTGPARGLFEADIKTLASEMDATLSGARSAAKSTITAVKGAVSQTVAAMRSGDRVSPALISELTSRAEATGDPAAIAAAQQAEILFEATSQLHGANIFAQEQAVRTAKSFQENATADTIGVARDTLAASEAILRQTRTALATDQVSYLNNNGQQLRLINPADIEAAAVGDPMLSGVGSTLSERRTRIDNFAAQNAADPIYFNKDESRAFGVFLKSATPAQALIFLEGLKNGFGDKASVVLGQIDNGEGNFWADAGAVYQASGNNKFFVDVFNGKKFVDEKGDAQPNAADKETRTAITSSLTSIMGGGDLTARMQNVAGFAYTSRLAGGAVEDEDGSLWRRTLQEAMGATYKDDERLLGGVFDMDGQNVILDPSMSIVDAEYVEDNVNRMSAETLAALVGEDAAGRVSKTDLANIGFVGTNRANQVFLTNAMGARIGARPVYLTELRNVLQRQGVTRMTLGEIGGYGGR